MQQILCLVFLLLISGLKSWRKKIDNRFFEEGLQKIKLLYLTVKKLTNQGFRFSFLHKALADLSKPKLILFDTTYFQHCLHNAYWEFCEFLIWYSIRVSIVYLIDWNDWIPLIKTSTQHLYSYVPINIRLRKETEVALFFWTIVCMCLLVFVVFFFEVFFVQKVSLLSLRMLHDTVVLAYQKYVSSCHGLVANEL